MDLYQSLSGMKVGELTAAQPELTIKRLNDAGIVLYGIQWESMLTCRVRIRRQDWSRAAELCKRDGADLKPVANSGLYWLFRSVFRRPVLIFGLAGLLVLYLFLPSRILFVQVQGNESIPTAQILEAAETCGIRFWAERREVRSEKMKNTLLAKLPQLQWAGVNTAGCVAIISVREGSVLTEQQKADAFTSMVAERSGFLLSATATKGSLMVQPGQTVKEGQLLISGYENCGICIRATGSEGEVIAQTLHRLEAVTPQTWRKAGKTTGEGKKYSLLLGKKRINLWKDSGISVGSCGRMYEEYYVTLPGGFQLPAALCVETFRYREEQDTALPQEESAQLLQQFASDALTGKMIAGEILQRNESIAADNGCWRLSGSYVCREMIGRLRQETDWRHEWEEQLNGSSAPSG